MTPLLAQFLSEARDFLQGIGEKLMELERVPEDKDLIIELFRLVHTLKGNTGLFDFPEMTRVLHAGEDLMDAIRDGRVSYSRDLADRLLDAMDFISTLCDEITRNGLLGATHAADSARLADSLRQLLPLPGPAHPAAEPGAAGAIPAGQQGVPMAVQPWNLDAIPEPARLEAYRRAGAEGVVLVRYVPGEGCFFQGEDPLFQARQTPGWVWGGIAAREPWPGLGELDAYRSVLDFRILTIAPPEPLLDHFRYVLDQVSLVPLQAEALALPQGDPNGGPVYEDFVGDALGHLDAGRLPELERAVMALLELSNPDLWLASALRWLLAILEKQPEHRQALRSLIESLKTLQPPDWSELHRPSPAAPPGIGVLENGTQVLEPASAVQALLARQRAILAINDETPWQRGRIRAAAAAIAGCLKATGREEHALAGFESALAASLAVNRGEALGAWLDRQKGPMAVPQVACTLAGATPAGPEPPAEGAPGPLPTEDIRFGRRAEDSAGGPRSLKVDQAKIDRLMDLIGEMVVSKNALPYLAGRAETVFGVRELSREIKAQYAVINRIAEEMQDAIMQVCMMPVSFVFQRFPRLVRDTSRKLGKDVNLVLAGEDTEADKAIIEALGDPLVHIVRNSLDHGFELPEARLAAGKPAAGTLTIRASQESDRVLIEIQDDGKGIDPLVIKRKAYETGVIDEATLDRISDQEALNLVFAPGLSTAAAVSDLSGRGVGMDVVRSAVEKVHGSIQLESELGRGTRIRLSLPLSMAVTNVMIIETDGQIFGVPMDSVIETVRVARSRIRSIKNSQATVLRGRIVALKSLNRLLGLPSAAKVNADDELAVLVVRLGTEPVGILVDHFRETVDIILKPMAGVLAGLPGYAGSALMGDGSVLMVLNLKEIL